MTPDPLRIAEALQRSQPLVRLQQQISDSAARFTAIRGLLPAAMAPHVSAGPVDELGWSLLTANSAVAAKLRQLQPRLEAELRQHGWPVCTIRVKVLKRSV